MPRKYIRKKTNVMQKTQWGYTRIFFNNFIGKGLYCIVEDEDAAEILESGRTITADRRINGDIDPCITINGRKVRLYNYLMKTDTANGEQCDHINHQTLDCRKINLRNGSVLQNLANTKRGIGRVIHLPNGKYGIKFPDELGIDTSAYAFDTKEESNKMRWKILSELDDYKDWVYQKSLELSRQYESYEFKHKSWIKKWLNREPLCQIIKLPPENPLNARLRNLMRIMQDSKLFNWLAFITEFELIEDYKASVGLA